MNAFMDTRYFELLPKVVPADRESVIRIRPLFQHSAFTGRPGLAVTYVRDDGGLPDGRVAGWAQFAPLPFSLEDGVLVVTCRFRGEGEHTFRVSCTENGQAKVLADFHVYSLAADWLALRPFKGDFHIHSHCSDGLEAPAYVAASCRRIGLDFMALTDHHRYQPSLEAMAAMAALPTDLRCYPGEEVHAPGNPVHVVNFGGSFSVNERFQDEAAFRREVAAYAEKLDGLAEPARYETAASEWCFDQIRAGGGVSIYCHPYWRPEQRYYVSEATNDAVLDRQRFDALEVIGGFYRHEQEANALAVARYQELRAAGRRIPVIGVSDAHGCDRDLFGWYYTIVLAPSVAFADLAAGIRGMASVAVEAVPGEFPRVVGPFRLVRYVYFLLREFYPVHDARCAEEGALLLAHLAGDAQAKARLAALQGRVPDLFRSCWAGGDGQVAAAR